MVRTTLFGWIEFVPRPDSSVRNVRFTPGFGTWFSPEPILRILESAGVQVQRRRTLWQRMGL
jgi:hypothetical protein